MIFTKKIIAPVILLFFCLSAIAQQADTLHMAEQLAYSNQYKQSLTLLEEYRMIHQTDQAALRLYLQVLYWNKEDNKAEAGYEQAMQTQYRNPLIVLDYSKFLVEHSSMDKAELLLIDYRKKDTINLEATYLLGLVYYSKGKSREAQLLFSKVVVHDPGHIAVNNYLTELNSLISPYVYTQIVYYRDQQPVTKIIPVIEAGLYKTDFLSPYIRFQSQQIIQLNDAYWLEGGNKIQFHKLKIKMDVFAGIIKLPANKTVQGTYGITVIKKIVPVLDASLVAENKPYLYTLRSLQNSVMQKHTLLSLNFGKSHKTDTKGKVTLASLKNWNAAAAFEASRFYDNNYVYGTYAWLMSPPIRLKALRLRVGYAYSYYTSTTSHYTSTNSLQDILAGWSSQNSIAGLYDPYFTPIDQQIHALTASISYTQSKFTLTTKGKYGVHATASLPYLYLQQDQSAQLSVATGFSAYHYTPFEFSIQTGWKISPSLYSELSYTYSRTLLFDSQFIAVSIKRLFIHD